VKNSKAVLLQWFSGVLTVFDFAGFGRLRRGFLANCDSLSPKGLSRESCRLPKELRDIGQNDFFKARLDQIVDMNHALARLARQVDWGFLETRFGAVYADVPGRPPLPTRLMAGLALLKHTFDLSDEVLCERWVENPYYQLFCGEAFFRHDLPFERSSITRWRQRMGEAKIVALIL
jgi:transposase, IS5 family